MASFTCKLQCLFTARRKHEDVFQGLKCGALLSQVLLPPPRMEQLQSSYIKLHLSSCCVTKHLCKESELNIWQKVFFAETFRALKVRLNSDYQTEQHETEKRRNGRKASRAAERLKVKGLFHASNYGSLQTPEFCFNQPSFCTQALSRNLQALKRLCCLQGPARGESV